MHDKRKILDMVQDGKISAAEATKLLDAFSSGSSNSKKAKRILFQIIQEGAIRPKVNIAIPIKLAKFGVNFIPKNSKINAEFGNSNFDFSSIDWKEIIDMASSGETGELFYMEVEDDDKQLIIRIAVE